MEERVILNSMHLFGAPVTLIRDTWTGPIFFYHVVCDSTSRKSHYDLSLELDSREGQRSLSRILNGRTT